MKKERLIEYIKQNNKLEKSLWHVKIIIKDDLPKDISMDNVIHSLQDILTREMLVGVDRILIGQFSELLNRQVNAAFLNGIIYCTNNQENERDLIDDIVHETAHSIEQLQARRIYFDNEVISEFLSKRKYVFSYLSYEGDTPPDDFLTHYDYKEEIDNFLFKYIGYPRLESLVGDIILSPYSLTSVREYWAIGFECYVSGEGKYVKSVCPKLFNKLEEIFR